MPPQGIRPLTEMLLVGMWLVENLPDGEVPVEAMARLARWLGVAPYGPWQNERKEREALRIAIDDEEQRLARIAPDRRHAGGSLAELAYVGTGLKLAPSFAMTLASGRSVTTWRSVGDVFGIQGIEVQIECDEGRARPWAARAVTHRPRRRTQIVSRAKSPQTVLAAIVLQLVREHEDETTARERVALAHRAMASYLSRPGIKGLLLAP